MWTAADGSLWKPVIRPISVPVISQRAPIRAGSDLREARAIPAQMSALESRRSTSSHSLPRGRSAVNGPAFVDGRRSASSTNAGRPRSVENADLQHVRSSPDRDRDFLHVPAHRSVEDRPPRSPPSNYPSDHQRSLPRHLGHTASASTRSAPAEWSPELDRERSQSLSADRRKYFPPLRDDRSFQRDDRAGQQLENTRREVSFTATLTVDMFAVLSAVIKWC